MIHPPKFRAYVAMDDLKSSIGSHQKVWARGLTHRPKVLLHTGEGDRTHQTPLLGVANSESQFPGAGCRVAVPKAHFDIQGFCTPCSIFPTRRGGGTRDIRILIAMHLLLCYRLHHLPSQLVHQLQHLLPVGLAINLQAPSPLVLELFQLLLHGGTNLAVCEGKETNEMRRQEWSCDLTPMM